MVTDAAGIERTRPLYTVVHNDKKRVAYFYDSDIGNYAYVTGHPMKPHRIRLAHSLVMNYGVYKYLEVYRAKPAVFMEMTQFHTDEYIDFLQKVTPDNMDSYQREQSKYNVGDDCPVFDGLFEFCGISAGGSMEGAARLNRNKCDIAINWAGGLHHAKKSEASGFCYVNDIVLAIIELLRFNKRVLYVDIDVHHGDGVEEAFYTTDRVMTASFHKYGEYFPGTGELRDTGIGPGKNYAVNFPLRDGIDDTTYKTIFQPVITAIMQYFQPDAVVLQCGGDSLSGDRLGCFNLSMRGHASCVDFVRSFNLPTLVVGGGGYTMRNVARTWAYETGRLVGVEMDPVLPYNEYYEYYGPDYELNVRASNMENANSYEYLEKIKIAVIENLKKTAPVPSVQMQDIPRQSLGMTDEEEAELDDLDEDENKDTRQTQRQWEKRRARQDEYEESDDEDMAQANGVNYSAPPRRSILDYKNPHADFENDSGAATPKRPDEIEAAVVPAAPAADGPAAAKDVVMEDADIAPAATAATTGDEEAKEGDAMDTDSGAKTEEGPPAEAAAAKAAAATASGDDDVDMMDAAEIDTAEAAPDTFSKGSEAKDLPASTTTTTTTTADATAEATANVSAAAPATSAADAATEAVAASKERADAVGVASAAVCTDAAAAGPDTTAMVDDAATKLTEDQPSAPEEVSELVNKSADKKEDAGASAEGKDKAEPADSEANGKGSEASEESKAAPEQADAPSAAGVKEEEPKKEEVSS